MIQPAPPIKKYVPLVSCYAMNYNRHAPVWKINILSNYLRRHIEAKYQTVKVPVSYEL